MKRNKILPLLLVMITTLCGGCTTATGKLLAESSHSTMPATGAITASNTISTSVPLTEGLTEGVEPAVVRDPATVAVAETDEAGESAAAGTIEKFVAPATAASEAVDPAVVAQGVALYRELFCGTCHALTVAGTAGFFGPTHDGIGTVAPQRIQESTYTGSATTAAEYLRESIVDPAAYIVEGYAASRHHMPPYSYLDEQQIEALVQMLLQQ